MKAKDAKNGKDAILPLRDRLATALKAHLEPLEATARPFGKLRVGRGADMLRIDLEAAGIPDKDEQGRIRDFHALRGTFATQLARSGVPLQAAQKMMRHSDPKLTSNFYTHLQVEEKAEELAKLPEIVIFPVPNNDAQ